MRISLRTLLILVAITAIPCLLSYRYLQTINAERDLHRYVRENGLRIINYRDFNNHAPSLLKNLEEWNAGSILEQPLDWIAIIEFSDMPTTITQIDELADILRRYQQPLYQINFANSERTNWKVHELADEFDEIFVSINNEIIENERREIRRQIANQQLENDR